MHLYNINIVKIIILTNKHSNPLNLMQINLTAAPPQFKNTLLTLKKISKKFNYILNDQMFCDRMFTIIFI